jgi:hypothetical protein
MTQAVISAMKKPLLIAFIFLAACQPAAATPIATLPAAATIPPSQTPVPFTNTPEPTATIEVTPTPLPRLFTNEFDSALAGWTILQTGNEAAPAVKTENSNLLLQMDAPFVWAYAVYDAQLYDNIRIEARFTNQAGSPVSLGLLCRYSETDGWLEYNVSTDGTYSLLYGNWLASGIANYLPIMDGSSNLIQPSGAAQEIGMVCSGTTVSLLVNQTVVRNVDVSRFELTNGKIGITVSSFENVPVIAAFDWLRVSEP